MTYKVIRYFFKGPKRTLHTGLTLAEAQAYTQDPEASSTTAKKAAATKRTRQRGPWFDGYTRED
jgi:hypothetical protein